MSSDNATTATRLQPIVSPFYDRDGITIYNADCRDVLPHAVDAIVCDPPYGTTACEWDAVIPFEEMWPMLSGWRDDETPVAMFGGQPFASALTFSNRVEFKYEWVWEKNISTNFLHASRQPLRKHETISVFYKRPGRYFPVVSTGHEPTQSARGSSIGVLWHGTNRRNYEGGSTERQPSSVLKFDAVDPKQRRHPSEKPVKLMQYLVQTYVPEGGTVLDFAMGSGTTLVAAKLLGRKAVGIEINREYCEAAVERLRQGVLDFGSEG